MKYYSFLFLFFLTFFASNSFAGDPPPTPEALPSSEKPVTLGYKAKGSASFIETYSMTRSGQCSVDTATSKEDATNIVWNSTWKVKPTDRQYVTARSPKFSGHSSRTDSSSCNPGHDFLCDGDLQLDEGYYPQLKIKKSGKKSFIVTINAEQGLYVPNASNSTCFQSSIFDNAITEGLNYTEITELRIKITRAKESKSTKIKFKINKSFDCTDPAKTLYFLSNSCTLDTSLSGTVTIKGMWSAKLLK